MAVPTLAQPAPAPPATPQPEAAAEPAAIAAAEAPETLAEDQSLTVWSRDPIRTLDPQKSGDPVSDQAIRLLFEGLYRPGPDGRPLPAMAERHEVSADGLTWRFHLRPGVTWADGAALTAGDFVTAFRRLADPAFGSPGGWFTQLMGLRNADAVVRGDAPPSELGVRAVDDDTLELALRTPTPWIDKAVMRVWTFPVPTARLEAAATDGAEWTASDRLIGNGPFALRNFDAEKGAGFTRNARWRDADSVRLTEIEIRTGGAAAAALDRFDAGEIDLLAVPGPLFGDWSKGREDAAAALPRACTNGLIVNVGEDALPLLKKPAVRRALSLAIDRQAIVAALGGGQRPAWGWVPPGMDGFVEPPVPDAARTQDDRMAEAARLMAGAGVGTETSMRLTLHYNSSPAHETVAAALRAAWKPLGVDLRLIHADWTEHADLVRTGEFQLARWGWCADVNDASVFLRQFRSDGINPGGFSDPAYDRLTAEAATAADPDPQNTRAAGILRDQVPIIPIFHYATPLLIAPDLRGVAWDDPMGGWSGQDIWRAAE